MSRSFEIIALKKSKFQLLPRCRQSRTVCQSESWVAQGHGEVPRRSFPGEDGSTLDRSTMESVISSKRKLTRALDDDENRVARFFCCSRMPRVPQLRMVLEIGVFAIDRFGTTSTRATRTHHPQPQGHKPNQHRDENAEIAKTDRWYSRSMVAFSAELSYIRR